MLTASISLLGPRSSYTIGIFLIDVLYLETLLDNDIEKASKLGSSGVEPSNGKHSSIGVHG